MTLFIQQFSSSQMWKCWIEVLAACLPVNKTQPYVMKKTLKSVLASYERKMRFKLVLEAFVYCGIFGLLFALWLIEPEFRVGLAILVCGVGYLFWKYKPSPSDENEIGVPRHMRLSYGRTLAVEGTGVALLSGIWLVSGFVEMTSGVEVMVIWLGILLGIGLWLFAERLSGLIFTESMHFMSSCICCELCLKKDSVYRCPQCEFKSSGKTISGLQRHFYNKHPEFSPINVFSGLCEGCSGRQSR